MRRPSSCRSHVSCSTAATIPAAEVRRSATGFRLKMNCRSEDKNMQQLEKMTKEERLDRMRHSAAHIMAEAVTEMFPDARIGIGPPIDTGFYYDFDLPR